MWIEALLEKYYDKMYQYKLNLRKKQIIFRGKDSECNEFISSLVTNNT